jgi:SAM-dependent methyltransferase
MVESELEAILSHDERHWWYRGRRSVLRAVIGGLDVAPGARVLDAGCGSGRMLDDLARIGTETGVDVSEVAVAAARSRGHADVHRARIEHMPFRSGSFSLVTCLDVIEHTPDDRRALAELRRVTRPGGHLLVTVPAYQSLWSAHDEINQHYRRYRRSSLLRAAAAAGWQTERVSYFNSMLLAPAAVVRLAERRRPQTPGHSDLDRTPPELDSALVLPLRLEAALLRHRVRIPFGLSLLAVLVNPAPVAVPNRPTTSATPESARVGAPSPV